MGGRWQRAHLFNHASRECLRDKQVTAHQEYCEFVATVKANDIRLSQKDEHQRVRNAADHLVADRNRAFLLRVLELAAE